MPYIDFAEIKRTVSIEQAAKLLNLTLKPSGSQMRGSCPACGDNDPRILAITPSRGLFFCFSAKKGGDCLALVQHITGLDVQEAASYLSANAAEDIAPSPAQRQEKVKEKSAPFDPAKFAAGLAYVPDLGITEEEATRLGVGEHRGKLYVALRDEFGFISGFVAVENPKFPKTLLKNEAIVKLKRA